MTTFLKQLQSFFEALSSKPQVGGLRITDTTVQYLVLARGGKLIRQASALPLPKGVVNGGKVSDRGELVRVLKQLHASASPIDKRQTVQVVVSLPPSITYAQSFMVPNVGPERLPTTASLNLQMISPIPADEAYMSWQLLKETKDAYELLGIFAERKVIDAYRTALTDAGFSAIAFEPHSLSLSWTVTDTLGARDDSILVLNVINDGLHMFVIKNGGVYFDYFHSWRSIQGSGTRITQDAFYTLLTEEVRKVVHFVSGRFQEKLGQVLLNTPGLEERIAHLLSEQFSVSVSPLASRFSRVYPSWLTVLGAAIRGNWDRSKDVFASLGTERLQVAFHHEQTLEFFRLWRSIAAVAVGIFLLLFGGGLVLLGAEPGSVEQRLGKFDTSAQAQELSTLETRANQFNGLVASVADIKGDEVPFVRIIEALEAVGRPYGVVLDEITMGGGTATAQAVMEAPSYEIVTLFKKALAGRDDFSAVDVPLATIAPTAEQFVRFTIQFTYRPPAASGE